MHPRGNEGLDFTPILTHYLFLFTSVLSIVCYLPKCPGNVFSLILNFHLPVGMVYSFHITGYSHCKL
jgi:SHO1 osmosensor